MQKLTKEQKAALKRVYDRHVRNQSYLQFRRTAYLNNTIGCVMVPVGKGTMWIDIEPDEYTHT